MSVRSDAVSVTLKQACAVFNNTYICRLLINLWTWYSYCWNLGYELGFIVKLNFVNIHSVKQAKPYKSLFGL